MLAKRRAYAAAIKEFTQAIRLDPRFAKAYNNRGYAYSACKDQPRALADLSVRAKAVLGRRHVSFAAPGDHEPKPCGAGFQPAG